MAANHRKSKQYNKAHESRLVTLSSSGMFTTRVALLLLAVLIVIGGYWLVTSRYKLTANRLSRLAASPASGQFNPQTWLAPSVSPNPTEDDALIVLRQVVNWNENVQWEGIHRGETVENNKFLGVYVRQGRFTSDTGEFFRNQQQLEALGWHEDSNLFGFGPGSKSWGYTKSAGRGKQRLLYFFVSIDLPQPHRYLVKVMVTDEF